MNNVELVHQAVTAALADFDREQAKLLPPSVRWRKRIKRERRALRNDIVQAAFARGEITVEEAESIGPVFSGR